MKVVEVEEKGAFRMRATLQMSKINNHTVDKDNSNITIDDFKDDILKLSHGKKNHVLFKIIN